MEKLKPKSKNILSLLLLAGLVFSVIQMARSAPPNPGHGWLEMGDSPNDFLPVARGGTGTTSLALNGVMVGNGANGVKLIAPGISGNLLASNGTTWIGATSPSVLTGAVFLLWSNETNSVLLGASTTETTLSSWVLNVVNTTYSYYLIEAQVNTNLTNNSNRNVTYDWNFKEGANLKKTIQWRSIAWTLAGVRNNSTNFAGTLKTVIPSSAVPNSANFLISGKMSLSHANATMMVRSFRVYGIK